MREPVEFTIGSQTYRAEPMDAKTQQHVARRVQPLLVSILPSITAMIPAGTLDKLKENPGALLDMNLQETVMPGLEAASNLLAQMPDETYDYVQAKCLSRVKRRRDGDAGWVSIWGTQSERLLDDNLDGSDSVAIMMKVLVVELAPFFFGLVSKSIAAAQP